MTDIGAAYVVVRPLTTGFAAETQAQLKQPLLSLGKFITGALAIKGGFDLGKAIVGDAARVQKSTEVIRTEFGKAGQSIIDFADKGGVALGIATHDTESAAARFGILFKNLDIGKKPAAEMTLNLEKLGGSIAAIRGIKADTVLGALPLALSGSLRSLRQLGFAFTPVQEKNEALKLGLISTVKQALDPGTRAITIYALATQHLGDYQALAKAHAHDLFNVQQRLSAEWDHAKEVLGTSLLPQVAKYGNELSNWIERMTKSGKLQADFNVIGRDTKTVIGDVVTVFKDLKGIVTTFDDLVGGGQNGIKILADAFLILYTRSKLIKWGIIQTGVASIGAAAKTSAAETTAATAVMGGDIAALKTETLAATGAMTGGFTALKYEIGAAGIATAGIATKTAAAETETLVAVGGMKAAFAGLVSTIKKGLASPFVILFALSIIPPNKKGQDALNKAGIGFLGHLPFIGGAEQQVAELGQKFHDTVFGKGSGFLGLGGTPKKPKVPTPSEQILKETFAQAKLFEPNLTPAIFKLEQSIARASEHPGVKKAAGDLGKGISKSIADSVTKSTKDVAAASANAALTALKSAAAAANNVAAQQLADAKYNVEQARQTLAQAIIDSKKAVADSIRSAKQNLNQIAASLAGDITSFGGTGIGGPLSKRFVALRNQILKGQGGPDTQRAAQQIAAQLQAQQGGGFTQKLNDLADLFNKGSITGKTANVRLDQILKSAGVNAAVIQRQFGVAAADQFRADKKAFTDQVKAEAAGPRAKGTGLEVAIVKPLEVLRQQDKIIARDAHALSLAEFSVERAALSAQKIAASEAQKQTKLLEKIAKNQPSKHESAAFDAFLKAQAGKSVQPKPAAKAGKTAGDITHAGAGAP